MKWLYFADVTDWIRWSSKMYDSVTGTAQFISPELRGKLNVSFPGSSSNQTVSSDGNYWVLETDYDNYAIVWSCKSFNDRSFRKSFIPIPFICKSTLSRASIYLLIFVIDTVGLIRQFIKSVIMYFSVIWHRIPLVFKSQRASVFKRIAFCSSQNRCIGFGSQILESNKSI